MVTTCFRHFIFILLCCISLKTQSAHVIFDLGGVLIDTRKTTVLWMMGPYRLLRYILADPFNNYSTQTLKHKLYATLERIQPTKPPYTLRDPDGTELPALMHDWLNGTKSPMFILYYAQKSIMQHPEWFASSTEQTLIKALLDILFIPHNLVETCMPVTEGFKLVKQCKQRGHNVYVLSNWGPYSFSLLKEKYTNYFNLFNGILISGQVGYSKPDRRIYELLCDQYNLDPNQCVFIDDQYENIQTAREYGMHGIHCSTTKRNRFNWVHKKIRRWEKQIGHTTS